MTAFAMLFIGLFSASSHALSFNALVKKADTYRMPRGTLLYLATVDEYDGSEKLRTTKYRVGYMPVDQVRVETLYPTRSVGRNLLMVGHDIWLQTPDIQRPTRVSFQQKLSGEVANGDLSRTNYALDYNAKKVGEEKVAGHDAYKLLLKAKSNDVTYSAIYYWIDKHTAQPIKAEFLTPELKVLKLGVFKNPKKLGGHIIMTELEFTDAIDPKRRSTLEFSHFKRAHFKPGYFNKESLRGNDEI